MGKYNIKTILNIYNVTFEYLKLYYLQRFNVIFDVYWITYLLILYWNIFIIYYAFLVHYCTMYTRIPVLRMLFNKVNQIPCDGGKRYNQYLWKNKLLSYVFRCKWSQPIIFKNINLKKKQYWYEQIFQAKTMLENRISVNNA